MIFHHLTHSFHIIIFCFLVVMGVINKTLHIRIVFKR